MKKRSLIIISAIAFVSILGVLSVIFHQDAPENTIRILVQQHFDPDHFRIRPLIEEKHYTYTKVGDDFELLPPDPQLPKLYFKLVRDENTRALIFLKGDADVMYNSLSLAKTEWLRNNGDSSIIILESAGESISQLALNSDKITDPNVKMAIKLALPIKLWSDTIFQKWVEPVESMAHLYDPEKAASLIQHPLQLNYLTMGTREGLQLAQLVRESLEKIGIKIKIHTFESALFYAKIKKREFDLYSSRPVPGNKSILDLPGTELIPLFNWKNGLILNKRISATSLIHSHLDESFRFLSDLRLQ